MRPRRTGHGGLAKRTHTPTKKGQARTLSSQPARHSQRSKRPLYSFIAGLHQPQSSVEQPILTASNHQCLASLTQPFLTLPFTFASNAPERAVHPWFLMHSTDKGQAEALRPSLPVYPLLRIVLARDAAAFRVDASLHRSLLHRAPLHQRTRGERAL